MTGQAARKSKPEADRTKSLIEVADQRELRDFVYEYSLQNAEFASAIEKRFSAPDFGREVDRIGLLAQNAIDDALQNHRWGPVELDLGELEEELGHRANSGSCMLAFAQASAVYEKLLEAVERELDSEISIIVDDFVALLEDASEKAGKANIAGECKYIFDAALKHAEEGTGTEYLDYCPRFLLMAANVAGEGERGQLDAAIARYGKNYSEEDLAPARLAETRRLEGPAKAEAFIDQNLGFDEIRRLAYTAAMDEGDWDKAARLCLERPNPDSWRKADWLKRLFAAYEAAKNLPLMAGAAKELLLLGRYDFSGHYDRLKAIHVDLGDWEIVYPGIIKAVKAKLNASQYMEILGKENELALLLKAVQANPKSVYDYCIPLALAYPDEVCRMFLDQISQDADQANTRDTYAQVSSRIAVFSQAGFGEKAALLIGELKAKNKRRPAFVDELGKVERQLSL